MKIETYYVISGVSKKDQSVVFYSVDVHSGGYPYWSTRLSQAEKWETMLTVPMSVENIMFDQVVDIAVSQIDSAITRRTPLDQYKKHRLQSELDSLEKQIEEKRKLLKSYE